MVVPLVVLESLLKEMLQLVSAEVDAVRFTVELMVRLFAGRSTNTDSQYFGLYREGLFRKRSGSIHVPDLVKNRKPAPGS
jgi:hypothetical protein